MAVFETGECFDRQKFAVQIMVTDQNLWCRQMNTLYTLSHQALR